MEKRILNCVLVVSMPEGGLLALCYTVLNATDAFQSVFCPAPRTVALLVLIYRSPRVSCRCYVSTAVRSVSAVHRIVYGQESSLLFLEYLACIIPVFVRDRGA